MGRIYTLSNTLTAVTAANTIFELGALANTPLKIRRIRFTQSDNDTDQRALISWGRYTASGTGTDVKSSVKPIDGGDAGFSGTAEDNHTADISTGEEVLGQEGISMLAGFEMTFLPKGRIKIPGGGFFGFNLKSAISVSDLVYFVELEESD